MTSIKGFFDNVREQVEARAEKKLTQQLPLLSFLMHEYAEEALKKNKKSSMTGNFINSFGVALYKDGRFIAISTTHQEEGKTPIQVTLASGDTFRKGRKRYGGSKQFHRFKAPEGTQRIFANQEVVSWLKRYPPTRKKGFSFRAVTVVGYADTVGGSTVLLRLADDIDKSGGIVSEFHLN